MTRQRRRRGGLSGVLAAGALLLFCVAEPVGATSWQSSFDRDYFAEQEIQDGQALKNIERFHLGDAFWRNYQEGHYKYALDDITFILRHFPNHPKALVIAGSIAKLARRPSLPIPYYQKALKLYPQYALTHAQYGSYLVDIGRIDPGIAKIKEGLKLDPNLAVAHAWLAKAYYKKGQADLAQQSAQRARSMGYRSSIQAGK